MMTWQLIAVIPSLAGCTVAAGLLGFIFGWRAGFRACTKQVLDRWSERGRP